MRLLTFLPYLIYLSLSITSCDDSKPSLRSPALRQCTLSVRIQLIGQPKQVGVIGAFNDYNPSLAPLRLLDATQELWGVDLALSPGDHLYALYVDGYEFNDPSAKLTDLGKIGNWQGIERSLARISDCSRGRWYRVDQQDELQQEGMISLAFERASLSKKGHAWQELDEGSPLQHDSVTLEIQSSSFDQASRQALAFTWRSDAPEALSFSSQQLTAGKYWIVLTSKDQRGIASEIFKAPLWIEAQPFKWEDGLMYQVVLDRLNPPEPDSSMMTPSIAERWGGTLASTLQLLREGYFERFAVRSLWLSPVYQNPQGLWQGVEGGTPRYEGYHGYWPTEPRGVGNEWGGDALLDELVQEAHQQGIRVILDVVLNHIHQDHPYFETHPDWFSPSGCLCGRGSCDWGRFIETCQFTDYLPDLRWHSDALHTQIEDALWWLERFNLDGLRVDAVPMMPRRVTRHLSSAVHERFEGLGVRHLLIGETFTGPNEWQRLAWYLGPWGLDGQFDFSLMWTLRDTIAWQNAPLSKIVDTWRNAQENWGKSASIMGLFVGNHDVTRFMSEAAHQLPADPWLNPPLQPFDVQSFKQHALAYGVILTLPGLPILYYGDEIGLAGANDPDNRRPFWPLTQHAWSALSQPQQSLNLKLTRLAQLRGCLPGLQSAEVHWRSEQSERLLLSRGQQDDMVFVLIERSSNTPLKLSEFIEAHEADSTIWYALLGMKWGEGAPRSAWPVEVIDPNTSLVAMPWSISIFTRSSRLMDCLNQQEGD